MNLVKCFIFFFFPTKWSVCSLDYGRWSNIRYYFYLQTFPLYISILPMTIIVLLYTAVTEVERMSPTALNVYTSKNHQINPNSNLHHKTSRNLQKLKLLLEASMFWIHCLNKMKHISRVVICSWETYKLLKYWGHCQNQLEIISAILTCFVYCSWQSSFRKCLFDDAVS